MKSVTGFERRIPTCFFHTEKVRKREVADFFRFICFEILIGNNKRYRYDHLGTFLYRLRNLY